MAKLPEFKTNDSIGNPNTSTYPACGTISPTTLRYIKVVSDLSKILKDKIKIIEIGGGYGGQCKIIHDYCKPSKYTMIDLAEPAKLQEKYLKNFGIKVNSNIAVKYDLCISNFAFSECYRDIQEKYIENILLKSKKGYITGAFNNMDNYTEKELLEIIPNSKSQPGIIPGVTIITWK
jgi:hypothetical protein